MGELSLQDAMRRFLKQSRLEKGVQAVQIEEIWEQVVGKTIAKYTDSIQLSGNTLYISSQVAPLKNELLFQKQQIIQRVNELMGENVVNDVVVR